MKKIYIIAATLCLTLVGCTSILDIDPRDRVPGNTLFSTADGVKAHMANLYGRLPIEDFTYSPNRGFGVGVTKDVNNAGFMAAHFCDEAIHPEYNDFGEEWFEYWDDGYQLIRDLNDLIAVLPTITLLSSEEQNNFVAETLFLRAYTYFALVKRYGGVPLLTKAQDYTDDYDKLKVPRGSEKETWDFILEDCDKAITLFGDNHDGGTRRADKWVVLALKSRVALYAGSIAKFTHQPYVSFSGPAVDQGLVGIEVQYANGYYTQCIDASDQIMKSGLFDLYGAFPATQEEAIENYRGLFESPDLHTKGVREHIFVKGYAKNSALAHNYDVWFSPRQMILDPNLFPSRMNPTLDFVDAFEDYTDDGTGIRRPLKTRTDGNERDYDGFKLSGNYISYPTNKPYYIVEGRDARLRAMVLFPGEDWRGTKIIIQGGMVKANGTGFHYRTQAQEVGHDGITYYTYGAEKATEYSGFDPMLGAYTRSGFLFRKFLQIKNPVEMAWMRGTQDWVDFRFAEILLNYAEAAVEKSDVTSQELLDGKTALNALRKRAAHTDEIALTQDNVRNERRVELAFENKRYWDLNRWRVFHKEFENRTRKGLVPFLDLRTTPAQYLFVRVVPLGVDSKNYNYVWYYRQIPGTSANGLVQNPR